MPIPRIEVRRQIWISGGIGKNLNDLTNYEDIVLGVGINEPINLEGFQESKKYNFLYVSRKE